MNTEAMAFIQVGLRLSSAVFPRAPGLQDILLVVDSKKLVRWISGRKKKQQKDTPTLCCPWGILPIFSLFVSDVSHSFGCEDAAALDFERRQNAVLQSELQAAALDVAGVMTLTRFFQCHAACLCEVGGGL